MATFCLVEVPVVWLVEEMELVPVDWLVEKNKMLVMEKNTLRK